MKIGVLIFSRYESSRLPGKALLKINGQELLGRVIGRAKQLTGDAGVVVATSNQQADDAIAKFARSQGSEVFRGDLNDVAKRAIDACSYYGWDAFARICGDRPFYDVPIVNLSIKTMANRQCDLVTTSGEYALPPGLTTEVVSCAALAKHYDQLTAFQREHLTSLFYEQTVNFDICYLDYPSICRAVYSTKLVVDTDKDLRRAEWIAKQMESGRHNNGSERTVLLDLACQWDQYHTKGTNKF